jgi:hypothetical protein
MGRETDHLDGIVACERSAKNLTLTLIEKITKSNFSLEGQPWGEEDEGGREGEPSFAA